MKSNKTRIENERKINNIQILHTSLSQFSEPVSATWSLIAHELAEVERRT